MDSSEVLDLEQVSSGVHYLMNGYFDYAETVIKTRALPNLYDGLKPVNRRILTTLSDFNSNNLQKSANVVGQTMGKYHPHGDSSIYEALVLMTDRNGSLAFPTIKGRGSFGAVFKTDAPAAMRYTECKLHDNIKEFTGEMKGIKMVPNFDMTIKEPEVLPVSFPSVLVNSTSGIAVGFRCNIPSFNFVDVCNLVKEYIKDGSCHTVIEPDFVTGGYYVRNEKELQKLMQAGVGKLKLRCKYIVDDKTIEVTEVPYGKTIQGLKNQINNSDISAIRNAYDLDDYEKTICFAVDCKSRARVDEALYELYRKTDMQYTYNADITVIDNGIPTRIGVWGIIEKWVAWRREVLIKEYTHRVDVRKRSMRECEAFMNVVNSKERKNKLVEIIRDNGVKAGQDYVRENFTREEVPEDLISFVTRRGLPSYHDGGKYASEYETAKNEVASLEKSIENIDDVIVAKMDALIAKYGSQMQRRTEITNIDYSFTSADGEKQERVIDESYCYYEFKNGFLKKLTVKSTTVDNEFEFDGRASDTLIALDNRGRVLRVYCEDIPVCSSSAMGVYLPRYFGLEETDDYKITYIGQLTGDELMLLYKDGYVGFLDTSEWVGNSRRIKVIEKGINPSSANNLGKVLNEWGEMLFVTDSTGRVGWFFTKDIKHKDRTAKTRVFSLYRDNLIDSYATMQSTEGVLLLADMAKHNGKLAKMNSPEDFRGDASIFTLI